MSYYEPEGMKKYTVNISIDTWNRLNQKSKSLGIYSTSIIVRRFIERGLKEDLSPDDIIMGRDESKSIRNGKHRRGTIKNMSSQWKWKFF